MGSAAESVPLEKETPSRTVDAGVQPIAPALPGIVFDPFVERLFGGTPAEPPDSAAGSISVQRLKAPVLQRAQRLYGNRASQQMIRRARTLQQQCACGGTCAKCQEEEEQRALQRTSTAPVPPDFDGIPTPGGEPLDASTRRPLEAHFGTSLEDVRVHTGSEAAKSATSLDALAYTSGRDIYFAAGMYAPASSSGQRLLAHEVAHVIQQGSGKEPSLFTKSARGVKVGAPDDSLESEAERAAEEFMPGGQPLTDEEQRKRRESSGTVQRFIQRQPAPGSPAPVSPTPTTATGADAGPAKPKPETQVPPSPSGEVVKTLDGVPLVEDPAFMRYQLEQLIIQGYGDSHYRFLMRLERDVEIDEMAGERAFKKQYEESGGQVAAGVPRSQEDFDAYDRMKEKERRVLDMLRPIAAALDEERNKIVADFESLAKSQARATLAESEKQEKSEAARYGIKWETIERMKSDCMIGECKESWTTYSMGEQSPAVTGLQGAAQILLLRRSELDEAHDEMDRVQRESLDRLASCAGAGGGAEDMECPGFEDMERHRQGVEDKYHKKKDAYDLMRGYLSEKYPILSVFSDPEKSTSDLKKLVSQTAGPEMAALLGKEIVDRLVNIEKVRGGLDDPDEVNVWRLPDLVRMTRELMGLQAKPVWNKWIDEKVERERPGIFWSIAIAVLNIAALIAAPVTGGLSLAVAAVVNAGVAIQHVKEYQMQKALTGTAFDKARALSQDEPSLFWLAVEIVGVAIDAAAAFKAISTAMKAVKTVQEAGDAARVVQKTEELKNIARTYGGDKLVGRVVAGLEGSAEAEAKALKALEVTGEESKLLEAGSRAAEKELEAGVVAGRAVGEGGVKISRAGHIFVCHSPCEYLLSKYSDLLGPEITLEGEATSLKSQYHVLEEEASKAAEAVRTATPEKLAEAQEAAAALERKVAAFDEKLARETAYSQATKKFALLDPAASAKFLKLEKNAAIRVANLDADAVNRLSKLELDALKKFGDLPEGALKNLTALDEDALKALGEMDAADLRKLENAQDLDVSTKVGSQQPWRGSGAEPKWDSPKGKPYRHVISDHGAQRTPTQILDRMRHTKRAQGIWRSNDLVVEAERTAPQFRGEYIIDLGRDVGDVYELDGSISKAVTKFFLRRGADGELVSAYPISNKFTGW